jgi:hypothetical protein
MQTFHSRAEMNAINEKEAVRFRNQVCELLKSLKKDIGDEYRSHEEATVPSMCVTLGVDVDEKGEVRGWNYQTGDNSYTGGAYCYQVWAVLDLDRRSNCKNLAEEAISQINNAVF